MTKVIDVSSGRIGEADMETSLLSSPPQYNIVWSDGTRGYIKGQNALEIPDGLYERFKKIEMRLSILPDDTMSFIRIMFVDNARYYALQDRMKDIFNIK